MFSALKQLCTAIAPEPIQNCTMMAKIASYPPRPASASRTGLHRDSFLAPLARGTKTLPGACVALHKRTLLPGR